MGVDPKVKCGLKEIDKFQVHLKDYQICVVSKDHMNTFIYKGDKKDKEIHLAYGDGHFYTIVSMRGYFHVDMFCHDCKKSRSQTHICFEKCKACQDIECKKYPASPRKIHCADCKLYFVNETCFNSHKKPSIGKLSRCQIYYRCEECGKIMNGNRYPKDDHDCNLIECTYCRQFESKDHLCFIRSKAKQQDNEEELGEEIDEELDEIFEFQTKKKKKSSKEPEFRYLFFDLESMTLDQMHEDAYGNENYYAKKHKVNCENLAHFARTKTLLNTATFVMTEKQFLWVMTVKKIFASGCLVKKTTSTQSLHIISEHMMGILLWTMQQGKGLKQTWLKMVVK